MGIEQEYNVFMDEYHRTLEDNDDKLATLVSYCLSHCKQEHLMSNTFYGKLDADTLKLIPYVKMLPSVKLPGKSSPYYIHKVNASMVTIQYKDVCIGLSFSNPDFRVVVNSGF